jgi:hypothetical protein
MTRKSAITSGILGVVLILIVTSVALQRYLEPMLKSTLIHAVETSGEGSFSVAMSEFDVQLFRRGLTISDLNLTSDSMLVIVKTVRIGRVSVWKLLWNKELVIGSILMDSARVQMIPAKDSISSKPVWNRITDATTPRFSSIRIHKAEARDGSITIRRTMEGDEIVHVSGVDMLVRNVAIDSLSVPPSDYEIRYDSLSWNLPNPLYRVISGPFELSTERESIAIKGLKWIPLATEDDFALVHHTHNRVSAEVDVAQISEWNSESFFHGNGFSAGKLDLMSPELTVTHDKRLPPRPYRYRTLMVLLINELSLPVTIDSVAIHQGVIEYRHRDKDHEQRAELRFDRLEAELHHVSNVGGPDMNLALRTRVMGEGILTLEAQFKRNSLQAEHEVRGRFKGTSFKAFNQILETMADMRISKGYLTELDFRMSLNDSSSRGEVRMTYDELTLEMTGRGRRWKSFLANRFVIDHENAGKDTHPIGYSRLKEKNMVHYWWMSLLTGIRATIQK